MTFLDEPFIHRALRRFEHVIVVALVAIMVVVIAIAALELGWRVIQDLATPPIALFGVDELLDTLGVVLLVLIAIELLETIKVYLHSHRVRVDIVLEVALIAIARKIIVLDINEYGAASVFSIATLVLALAAASYLEHRARVAKGPPARPPGEARHA